MNNIANQEAQSILLKVNFPVPPITNEEVQKILDNKLVLDQNWINWFEDFFGLPRVSFTKELLNRFQEINTPETFMNVVPAIQKLLKPLKDSCKAYSLGLYSASITLSAVAAESLQILLWEMQEIKLHNKEMTKAQEKAILGREFQKLEQSRRIAILDAIGGINSDQKILFHQIRDVRNRYLHSWDQNFDREKEDALLCYQRVFQLFREITGVKLKDASSIEANPLLTKWMNKNITI
ncbi:MAG: hypothetical protein ABII25_00035 [bacterium]